MRALLQPRGEVGELGVGIRADVREVVNAILSVVRNGTTWRALPHDYPPWRTVYHYFRA